MTWIWPILGILVVAMWMYALYDIIKRRHEMSGAKIAAWVIVILVFPVVGVIVYYLANVAGGPSGAPRGPEAGGRPL
jgi:hypothetical protein